MRSYTRHHELPVFTTNNYHAHQFPAQPPVVLLAELSRTFPAYELESFVALRAFHHGGYLHICRVERFPVLQRSHGRGLGGITGFGIEPEL